MADNKGIKTIILSELPKHEKVKYFQFLLDNDINFTKDDKGNYIALVKVLNPQFYNDVDNQQEKMKQESNIKSIKNSDNNNYVKQQQQVLQQSMKSKQKSTSNKQVVVNEKPTNVKKENIDPLKYLKQEYLKFFTALNPLIGVRPKKLNFYQLKFYIEEIYSVRFIKDTTLLRNKVKNSGDGELNDPFPSFLIEFLTNKYIKKPMLDKNALDILLTADFYKDKSKEIEIFIKFITEEFDSEDLIFYLFVRNCIEKEMKMMFIEKAKEEIKIQYNDEKDSIDTELYLSIGTCLTSKFLI